MTTSYYQQVSAAYVLARQAEEQQEPPKPDPHASYEPKCLMAWATSVAAVDQTAGIQEIASKEKA